MSRPLIASAGALLWAAAPVAAQDTAEREPTNAAQITVYGWLAGATGAFRPFAGAPTIGFDDSFGEVLGDLDAAFFANALVRRDRFVATADISYAALSREGRVPPGIPAEGKISQLAITALAGVRAEDSEALTVDLLAGARLWNLDGRIAVPLAGVAVAPGRTFVDPVIAARLGAPIAPRLSALLQADLGGFGVGSDLTYQLTGTLNYRASDRFVLSGGWRHLHLDYARGGTRFEGSQTGPIIGVTHRF
ncbi:hypothetical protein [Erythrobacter sp. WG]|uniref:hypothetical protein n=1 Tax=Erythrobacter sp. WG TaxID=2985510 RepID=UPI00226F7E6F|nr:hypothetical protein [Erythrobacter sp. WG]MCX9147675.1 hypothetical protein [Erythrobacter sp. WG]